MGTQEKAITPREARVLFTTLMSELIVALRTVARANRFPGLEVAFGEGYVGLTDAADGDHDGPHMKGGTHYLGTGVDLLFYENGKYITDGDHPAIRWAGERWESMHPLARWGGRFRDGNHFSIEFGGKK